MTPHQRDQMIGLQERLVDLLMSEADPSTMPKAVKARWQRKRQAQETAHLLLRLETILAAPSPAPGGKGEARGEREADDLIERARKKAADALREMQERRAASGGDG